MLDRKKHLSRLQNLLQLLENTQTDPFLYYAVAMEYQKQNDTEKACAYYQKLMDNKLKIIVYMA